MPGCNNCQRQEGDVELLTCLSCYSAQYCSQECQRADWGIHRGPCRAASSIPRVSQSTMTSLLELMLGEEAKEAYGASPSRGLDKAMPWPFTRLQNGTFLHDRSEKDVYRILIDSYRFRMEEHCQHGGKPEKGSIYDDDVDDGLPGFQHYLKMAESRDGLLPSWWTPEKQKECEKFGMSGSEWQDLRAAVEQSAIMFQYGDSRYPSQLRMLAEAVYEKGLGGTSSFVRRGELVEMEAQQREKDAKAKKEAEDKKGKAAQTV